MASMGFSKVREMPYQIICVFVLVVFMSTLFGDSSFFEYPILFMHHSPINLPLQYHGVRFTPYHSVGSVAYVPSEHRCCFTLQGTTNESQHHCTCFPRGYTVNDFCFKPSAGSTLGEVFVY